MEEHVHSILGIKEYPKNHPTTAHIKAHTTADIDNSIEHIQTERER